MTRRDWIRLAEFLSLALRVEVGVPKTTFENFEETTLSSTIFAETNRVRVAQRQRRLQPLAAFDRAAADRARTR